MFLPSASLTLQTVFIIFLLAFNLEGISFCLFSVTSSLTTFKYSLPFLLFTNSVTLFPLVSLFCSYYFFVRQRHTDGAAAVETIFTAHRAPAAPPPAGGYRSRYSGCGPCEIPRVHHRFGHGFIHGHAAARYRIRCNANRSSVCSATPCSRGSNVVCVTGCTVPNYFCQDVGPSCLCVLWTLIQRYRRLAPIDETIFCPGQMG